MQGEWKEGYPYTQDSSDNLEIMNNLDATATFEIVTNLRVERSHWAYGTNRACGSYDKKLNEKMIRAALAGLDSNRRSSYLSAGRQAYRHQ